MRRTAARLADGREIVYFDDDGAPPRTTDDPRPLRPVLTSSQLRYDPLLDEWVAIATHRQTRTHLPSERDCPLCPSTAGRQTEIPSDSYDVVVFENRFPALAGENGRCEVVCFTSDHDASFATLPVHRARLVIEALVDRTTQLGALPGVEQVYCFENRGPEIGVTLSHPHGQIYAYPFVTPRTRQMLSAARSHRERTGGNLFGDVLTAERSGERVVPALASAERDDLATLYLDVLGRLDRLYDAPLPYIAAWHQAPAHADRDLAWLHLQLFSVRRAPGKLKYLAGTEAGMGAFSNDVLPEEAARRLREAGP